MEICIEHIPWNASSDDLRNLCLPFGEVLYSTVMLDSDTHRSRGYGVVGMEEENCKKAIKKLNGSHFNSYHLKAQIACI